MVVYIYGKLIKKNKNLIIGLSNAIFGVGRNTAERLCAKVGLYPRMRAGELSEFQILALNKEISGLLVEETLKKKINDDIKLKKEIGCYSGLRHEMGLPVHGQRTRNNSHTAAKLNKLIRH